MIVVVQVVPKRGIDTYRLLRDKVTYEARTWTWANRRKTWLRHKNIDAGYIEVGAAEGVLVAVIRPSEPSELYFLVERFIGRLVAWFEDDLAAINIQLTTDSTACGGSRRAQGASR